MKTNNPDNNPEQQALVPQFIPGANRVVMVPFISFVDLLNPHLTREQFLALIVQAPEAAAEYLRAQAMAFRNQAGILNGQVQVLQHNLDTALTGATQLNNLMKQRNDALSNELEVTKKQLAEAQAALAATQQELAESKNKSSDISPTLSASTSYASLPSIFEDSIWGVGPLSSPSLKNRKSVV